MSDRIEIDEHLDMVKLTVSDVYRRWRDHVEFDDLLGEAAVWWYGPGQKYLAAYLSEDAHFIRLRRSIWRWCARYAEKAKADAAGYEPADQFVYSTSEILTLLPLALAPDDGVLGSGTSYDDTPRAKKDPSEGNNLLVSVLDVRRALDRLDEDDLQFLYLCDDLQHDWERVVSMGGLEVLPDTARRRHSRVILRLAHHLNGNHHYSNPEEIAA